MTHAYKGRWRNLALTREDGAQLSPQHSLGRRNG